MEASSQHIKKKCKTSGTTEVADCDIVYDNIFKFYKRVIISEKFRTSKRIFVTMKKKH